MPGLADLLSALAGQVGCEPFEIVAVDSGSTDGSLEALAAAGARVERIEPAAFRFGPTRQRAFELTRGRVIVTLSQDAVPGGPGWLAAMTGPILEGRADLVQAEELPPADAERLGMVQNFGTAYGHWPMPWLAISCSGLAISRPAWAATGFGPVAMSEDKYLGAAARRLGLRMEISRGAPLLHGHAFTFASLARRAFNEGMGARQTDGRYSLRQLLRDGFGLWRLRWIVNAALRRPSRRDVSLAELARFPVRPIFCYLGYRFGRRYWR
jgi:rhamnosyltransferase